MDIHKQFIHDQPPKYTLLGSLEKTTDSGANTGSPWDLRSSKPWQMSPFGSAEHLNRQSDSYMIVSHAPTEPKPLPKNTKGVMKWSRSILLLLRLCSWLGAGGLLACVICIRTVGTAMDWFMRIPPPVALIHLTYAIYHLSRPAKIQNPSSSASYTILAAILDVCLIPFQVLLAILAHNQLSNTLDDGTPQWTTILGAGSQTHIIIYSTYLISIVTGGLLLLSFCICISLAIRFRKIARLPPYMNPFEDNLTTRGHQKANVSISTIASDGTHKDVPVRLNTKSQPAAVSDHTKIGSRSQTVSDIDLQSEKHRQSKLSRSSPLNATGPTYPVLSEHMEDWGTHPPAPSESPSTIPPQFRHLRHFATGTGKPNLTPLLTRPKYDFTNRSPRPLGLHPPTPRQDTHDRGKRSDVRALRNVDGNSSATRISGPSWEDVRLDVDYENYPVEQASSRKHYGDIVGTGNVASSRARVVSSGMDNGMHRGMKVRMREVSGKVAEEGRAGYNYIDF